MKQNCVDLKNIDIFVTMPISLWSVERFLSSLDQLSKRVNVINITLINTVTKNVAVLLETASSLFYRQLSIKISVINISFLLKLKLLQY